MEYYPIDAVSMIQGILGRINAGDVIATTEFLRAYAKTIYAFPKIKGLHRVVEPGEFYEYVASKVNRGKLLTKYDPSKGSFDPWFATVMENDLKTLAKLHGREKGSTILSDAMDEIAREEPSPSDLVEFREEADALSRVFQQLNNTEKAVAILYGLFYRDVADAELEFLATTTGRNQDQIARELQDLLTGELLEEEKRIRSESAKIRRMSESILRIQTRLAEARVVLECKIENNSAEGEIDEAKGIVERLEAQEWKKRTKYIELSKIQRRGQGLVVLKNRKIAEFLKIPLGTVTSAMTRLRTKVRRQSLLPLENW